MMSWQAKTVQYLLKATTGKRDYNKAKIQKHRRNFARNMRILFPPNRRGMKICQSKIAGIAVTEISKLRTLRQDRRV